MKWTEGQLFEHFSCIKNLVHAVTQKDKNQPYDFSLALHTDENPIDILKNRAVLQKHFPAMNFVIAQQVHGSTIEIVDKADTQGWNHQSSSIKTCDALITNQKNMMLTVLTADCVPILLYDVQKKVIAVVHAGWRGTKERILYKTILKMQEKFDSNPKDILAGIAPAIGRCCYEVDASVSQHFKEIDNGYDSKGDKQMLDLPYINKLQLLEAKLPPQNIEMSTICTACDVEKYFSYRKENECSGRFVSMIGMV
jgi:YfiH family protein